MFEVKLERVDALRPKMQKLNQALNQKLVRQALTAGGRKIRDRARAIVSKHDDPKTGRQIAKNIVTRYRSKRSRQTGDVVVSVGVIYPKGPIPKGDPQKPGRQSNPDDGVNTPHWHLLEVGSEHSRAFPFLIPAATQEAASLPQVIVDDLSKRLDKEVSKL